MKCTCLRELEMYNGQWCPACEIPEREAYEILNVIKALNHIEVAYDKPGYKSRMWDLFFECYEFSNDSYVSFYYPDYYLEEHPDMKADFELFMTTYKLDETIPNLLLSFSW